MGAVGFDFESVAAVVAASEFEEVGSRDGEHVVASWAWEDVGGKGFRVQGLGFRVW